MINFKLISDSIDFYSKHSFVRIETPWIVPSYIDNITKPKDAIPFSLNNKDARLVGSGEQSFLLQYMNGYLPKGKFQTVTPCFREENQDFLHKNYFIKNELIQTCDVNESNLKIIVSICFDFYNQYLNGKAEILKTNEGYDITFNGIELGSYGIRSCDFLDWIYATGCAEPRLSSMLNLKE